MAIEAHLKVAAAELIRAAYEKKQEMEQRRRDGENRIRELTKQTDKIPRKIRRREGMRGNELAGAVERAELTREINELQHSVEQIKRETNEERTNMARDLRNYELEIRDLEAKAAELQKRV